MRTEKDFGLGLGLHLCGIHTISYDSGDIDWVKFRIIVQQLDLGSRIECVAVLNARRHCTCTYPPGYVQRSCPPQPVRVSCCDYYCTYYLSSYIITADGGCANTII